MANDAAHGELGLDGTAAESGLLDFAEDDTLAGFRLRRLELYNWGTFHHKVYVLPMEGRNALLTGEIGSGKSTIVDAVTTLLVPAGRVSYNKAAGAEFRERDLRSYVLGYHKSERSSTGSAARPVPLRDRHSYSVILAVFANEGFGSVVTLAQVFHQKESTGQPYRFYVVSDSDLSIAEHFSGFGSDLSALRKQIRNLPHTEAVFDSFPPYGAAFRRRFGLQSEQALELFHQTVSMKAVGNLTEFVREHMLESFDVQPRIEALITHFEDLNQAHEAVLRAKRQIELLDPLVEKLDQHAAAEERKAHWLFCRSGLRAHFAALKAGLLETRIGNLEQESAKAEAKRERLRTQLAEQQGERDEIKQAIAQNGGDRLESLRKERAGLEQDRNRRMEKFEQYRRLCETLELPLPETEERFVENRHALAELLERTKTHSADLDNRRTEAAVEFKRLRGEHQALQSEIESLKQRRSNIDSRQIAIRDQLCEALELEPAELPFAGELIMVREEEAEWEGAIERLLRNFGLSLLVPDALYSRVAEWVDRTNLRGRLVYFRARADAEPDPEEPDAASLIRKLTIKPDTEFRGWLERELQHRFDYTCCETLQEFRRASRAITRAGQIKGSKSRHEKDDRHDIGDRSRYVLGWRNDEKIRALEAQARELEPRIADTGTEISRVDQERSALNEQIQRIYEMQSIARYDEIHWQPVAERIEEVEAEIAQLESASDVLARLNEQLTSVEQRIAATDDELRGVSNEIAKLEERLSTARTQHAEARETADASETPLPQLAEHIEPVRHQALGEHRLTVESCDNRQQDLREWIQAKIDGEDKRLRSLHEQIVRAMGEFRRDYPAETSEMDATVKAGAEYRALLERLRADDLPRFEDRFKSLLNENTIREIANFHAQLARECQKIRERVARINESMAAIEFNKDRYIRLEVDDATDSEIRSFRQELKSCTEGSFTGSREDQYTEQKFLQVKRIIDRFRGREGFADLDRRWTEKVTDVRNWFTFAASERWKEDDTEHEHYADSGGKSGGQKEKLAYTVLAASLAYQFGLEFGETRSRSFRFVAIDEAFGKGSEESARYGLSLFSRLNLQLLIVTPLRHIHIIEPYVSTVGFVHARDDGQSLLRCLTIDEYREEMRRRGRDGHDRSEPAREVSHASMDTPS